jgi:apolipoprotein N-acyltransferase
MVRALINLLCAAASGCLLFLACADFDVWPLAWFAFLPLLVATHGVRPRRAFLYGWLCGLIANGGGFYWITNLLMRFGHMSWPPSFALFLLLALYQGLHFGLFLYLLRRVQRRAPHLPATLVAPVLMTALELLMPFIFPWYLAITQAWVLPVIQIADLTGPLGVTFLLMLANGMLYDLVTVWRERRAAPEGATPRPLPRRALIAGSAALVFALGYGALRIHQIDARWRAAPKVKIGVVQANIGIVQKGQARLAPDHLRIHQEETRKLVGQGAELVIWPESSYPYALEREATRDWPALHPYRVMKDLGVPLIFGVITWSRDEKYPHNSALFMEPDGRITGRFDKNYLLVFGEYIPFYEQLPAFKKWFPAASHFARGTEVTSFSFRDWRIGPLICYEDIIPAFGRRLAPLKPNLLVNVTNDAWFGATSEPYEHLALSVFRSVEHRLALVRSVNTGVSAYVDAKGKVYNKSKSVDPVITPGVPPVSLVDEVAMLQGSETVYAAVGDLFGYLDLALAVALVVLPVRLLGGRSTPPAAARKHRKPKKRR